MFFGLPKGTHCLNTMKYYGASIENIYCHQAPSIVTQSIGIYDPFKISPIGQRLLLILAHAQYFLKVESPSIIVS